MQNKEKIKINIDKGSLIIHENSSLEDGELFSAGSWFPRKPRILATTNHSSDMRV